MSGIQRIGVLFLVTAEGADGDSTSEITHSSACLTEMDISSCRCKKKGLMTEADEGKQAEFPIMIQGKYSPSLWTMVGERK